MPERAFSGIVTPEIAIVTQATSKVFSTGTGSHSIILFLGCRKKFRRGQKRRVIVNDIFLVVIAVFAVAIDALLFGQMFKRLLGRRQILIARGGLATPCYSAPELTQANENITYAVDYFSFGAVMHEYLTGQKLYPKAGDIYNEDSHLITKRYLEYIESGRENVFYDDRFPEIHDWIDALTTFDSTERMKKSPNLFALAHKLREEVNALGYRDVNTDFLWNQLNEYGNRTF